MNTFSLRYPAVVYEVIKISSIFFSCEKPRNPSIILTKSFNVNTSEISHYAEQVLLLVAL